MSLFNTGLHYNVYLNIPESINFSWNVIYDDTVFDIAQFTNHLDIKDNSSLIVLWGVDRRINTNDVRFYELNEFYHSIPNPMVLFNGCVNQKSILEFPVKQVNFFQQLSKQFYQPRNVVLEKHKKFLYSSTKDYPERRYILKTVDQMFDQGTIAYKCIDVDLSNKYYLESNYNKIINVIEPLSNRLPIIGYDNSVEFSQIPKEIIDDSYMSIITETYYHGPIFFSEKIFNAMLYGHIFIYLGPTHSLKRLKELGFKTWSHIIDESYDDIDDPYLRLLSVNNSIKEFLSLDIERIKQLYQDNIDIIEHNKKLVLDTDITNDVVSTMLDAIRLKNGRV